MISEYIAAGWKLVPIPPGSKSPRADGWNLPENALLTAAILPEGWGVGLMHSYSNTCAIDLDDLFMASVLFAERGIDLQALLDDDNAVQVVSGRQGSGKLLYRLDEPMPSRSIKVGPKTIVEFRSGTSDGLTVQCVLPPSKHPSGTTYAWGGKGNWQALPPLPESIRTWWEELQVEKHDHTPKGDPTKVDWENVKSAIKSIPANCSHDEWLEVIMALHSTKHAEAFELAREWSMSCPEKYPGDRTFGTRWGSFKDKQHQISIASLFHHAKEHGWVAPPIDVTKLFNAKPPENTLDMLGGMLVLPPTVDLNLFPTVMRDYVVEVSESIGCDPLVPISAGLAAVCAAIDSRSRLELTNGFKVPPVLWMMTIGSPADKKSPASKPMFSVLADIERDDATRYKMDMLRWEAEEAAFAAAKKDFLAKAGSAEHMMGLMGGDPLMTLPQMPILRPQPVPKRLVISDSTSQKMVRLAAERPEGFLCYLDEANGFMTKLTNPVSGDDRSTWVVAYESARYFMDRVNAGSIVAENLAVSIYCNVQPQVFRRVLPDLSMDGFVQRFIPVTLRPSQTRLGNPTPAWGSCKPDWDHMIRQVHAAGERHYTLSEAAYGVFREFQQWYEAEKRDERLIRSPVEFMTAFGKLEGLAGRVALVLHMMEDRDNPVVGAGIMRRAARFVEDFVVNSLRYCYSDIGGLREQSPEYWITNHILMIADTGTVTLSEIRRSGRRQWENLQAFEIEQTILATMATLTALQWVAVVEETRRGTTWAINPALIEAFRKQREVITAKKLAYLEKMRKHSSENAPRAAQEARHGARGVA